MLIISSSKAAVAICSAFFPSASFCLVPGSMNCLKNSSMLVFMYVFTRYCAIKISHHSQIILTSHFHAIFAKNQGLKVL